MTIYKKDADKSKLRMEAWWNHEIIDRAVVQVSAPLDVAPANTSELTGNIDDPARYFTDPDVVIPLTEYHLARRYFGGEAFPVAAGIPVHRIDRVRLDRQEIAILTPDEVRRLLFAARNHVPELVPYLAIAVFAGVRPAELKRLTWDRINFDLRYIHITGGTAKVRGERYVDMEAVLVEWLKPYRQNFGPICSQDTYGLTKLFDKVRKKVGLKKSWKADVLRHSYASYHVAKYERKDKIAMMMGNSVKMLDRHYRKPLHRNHAHEFWSILPE